MQQSKNYVRPSSFEANAENAKEPEFNKKDCIESPR
jgi:hypothetical protein